jgi:hypothetical protein
MSDDREPMWNVFGPEDMAKAAAELIEAEAAERGLEPEDLLMLRALLAAEEESRRRTAEFDAAEELAYQEEAHRQREQERASQQHQRTELSQEREMER